MFDSSNSKFISIEELNFIESMSGAPSIINAFQNEEHALVNFLLNQAYAESVANLSKTFLLVSLDLKTILGYFSISTDTVARNTIKVPHGTLYNTIPAALIGRLARDSRNRGTGIGEVLLFESFKNIVSISNLIGLKVIITDAKNATAKTFYESYGFKAVKGQTAGQFPFRLYLSVVDAKAAVAAY